MPPFRPGAFDFVFSVGALHHTPDCRSAFRQCASLVRQGGRLSVWLYPTERRTGLYARAVHFVQDDLMRPVTCRMPPSWLYHLCRVLGRMTFWRDAANARGRTRLAKLLALFAVGSHTEPKMAEFLNFDWYSPQYRSYHSEEELLRWFGEEGFAGITILPMRTSGSATRPLPGETLPLHPAPRLQGWLDCPCERQTLRCGDDVLVQGWAFDVSGHSPVIEIFIDGRKVKALQCFCPRIDVKRAYPDVPHALYCGYSGTLQVPRSWAPRVILKVTARSQACAPVVLADRALQVERRSSAN